MQAIDHVQLALPTLPALLVAASAAIILTLGSLHLLFTFRGTRLHPRDPALIDAMKVATPNLTRDTTMWRTWIGFNGSHSVGAMLFGLMYGYLALAQAELLFGSFFLRALGLATLLSLAALGLRYWFRVPNRGIVAATVLYVVALILDCFA